MEITVYQRVGIEGIWYPEDMLYSVDLEAERANWSFASIFEYVDVADFEADPD